MDNPEDIFTVALFALKCSDIGHGAKKFKLHEEWSHRVNEEFFCQGDKEKLLGIPITPDRDRNLVEIEESQYDFLIFSPIPLFELFCSRFPQCNDLLSQMKENLKTWKNRIEEKKINTK